VSANEALAGIAVRQARVPGVAILHPARRVVQYLTLLALILVPTTGLFRIDIAAGSAMMLDRQVWFSDIFIVLGLWVLIASLLILTYAWVGSVFCGWVCPQNSASEFANMLTARLLGRSADMTGVSGERMQISARKRSMLNYLLLGIGLLLPAMVFALIPLLYFNAPSVIWSYMTFAEGVRGGSLYWIYILFVALFLLDIAAVRHLLCRYMCIYRVWQQSFRSAETLRIDYDAQRADHCATCHYCVDACIADIDPRKTDQFDGCVNCGECVVACDTLHQKSKKLEGPGLLRFVSGSGHATTGRSGRIGSYLLRAKTPLLAAVAGAMLLITGIIGYQANEFSVYHDAEDKDGRVLAYRISLAHKLFHPADVSLRIEGLHAEMYQLEKTTLHFDTAGRQDLSLHIDKALPKGLHQLRILASSSDGWSGVFNVTHFAPGS